MFLWNDLLSNIPQGIATSPDDIRTLTTKRRRPNVRVVPINDGK